MTIIKLAACSEVCNNEYSYISTEENGTYFTCHICAKYEEGKILLCIDNSEGNNSAVSICEYCAYKIFKSV